MQDRENKTNGPMVVQLLWQLWCSVIASKLGKLHGHAYKEPVAIAILIIMTSQAASPPH